MTKLSVNAQTADSLMAGIVKAKGLKIDRPGEAIAILERLLPENPNSHILKGLMTECLLNDGRPEEALKLAEENVPFKKKGKRSKEDQIAWFIYAKVLFALKRYDEAYDACEKSGKDPDPVRLKTKIERLLDDLNKPKQICLVKEAQKIWEEDQDGALALLLEAEILVSEPYAEIYVLRTRIYLHIGDRQKALASAENFYTLGKTDAESVALLNAVRVECGKDAIGEGKGPLAEGLAKLMQKGFAPLVVVSSGQETGEIVSEDDQSANEADEYLADGISGIGGDDAECLNESVNLGKASDVSDDEILDSLITNAVESAEVNGEPAETEDTPKGIYWAMNDIRRQIRSGEIVVALSALLEIAAEAEHIAEFHHLKAYAYLSMNKFEQAEICARKALALDPENMRYMTELSKVLSHSGKLEEALHFAEMAAKSSSHPGNFINLAEILRKLKRCQEALEVLKVAGNSVQANVCAAYSNITLGRSKEAFSSLDEAKNQAEKDGKERFRLLRIYSGYLFAYARIMDFFNSPDARASLVDAARYVMAVDPGSLLNLQQKDYQAALSIIEQHGIITKSPKEL
jgi:tetratricopeptide (TPR) repeat protein